MLQPPLFYSEYKRVEDSHLEEWLQHQYVILNLYQMYVPGTLENTKSVLVNIGTGYFVEKVKKKMMAKILYYGKVQKVTWHSFNSMYMSISHLSWSEWMYDQRAKKVVSKSPRLVDFTIGLVNFVFNLPDRQVKFCGIQMTEELCNQSCASKHFWGWLKWLLGLYMVAIGCLNGKL